jgi:PPOX class probable FMN-dependent enzyme
MHETSAMYEIQELDDLLALYGNSPKGAMTKETAIVGEHYRALIEASPFCALATTGPGGLDCTPRGDAPGFVRVIDETTLELPDRRGNNRLDSLRNILDDPNVALLFLVPGRNETMRVNGKATITIDPDVLRSHAVNGKTPASVIRVAVDTAYYQCGKAPMRSNLWKPEEWADIDHLPSTGTISAGFNEGTDIADFDANLDQSLRDRMY